MDSTTSDRPVLLLDIDGTVSPLRLRDESWRPYTVHAAGLWDVIVHDDVRDRIRPWIASGRVEALWLTDWEQPECDDLAAALDWPRLLRLRPGPDNGGWWKEAVVRGYLDRGRRVIWADDQASTRASGTIVEGDASIVEPEFGFERPDGVLRNDGSLLVISPSRRFGLTRRDLDLMEAFIASSAVTS